MPTSSYGSEYVQCPFFIKNSQLSITCEGPVDSGLVYGEEGKTSTICTTFLTGKDKNVYRANFCDSMDRHKHCFIYRTVMEKYKEEE